MNSTFRFYIRKVICNSMMNSSSKAREARMLKKMIDRSLTKPKSRFQASRVLKKHYPLSAYENEGTNKRMVAFNKVYMEHIPEMIYSGDFGSHFNDLKIQISKIQLSKDFNFLNIFYIIKDSNTPENLINEVLRRIVRELQMRITELRLSVKVPYIRFINDVRLENEIKLENLFETIDLGKDSLSTHSKKVITPSIVSKPGDLPVMRQDVFGVEVAKIKQRISESILRFKAINTNKCDEPATELEYPTKLIQFSKKEFFKFYKSRRIEELKQRKKELQGLYEYENENAFENEYEDDYEGDYEVEYKDEYEGDYEVEYKDEYEGDYEVEYEDDIKSKL